MAQYKGPASEGQRVMQLQKKRERHQEELEFKKKKLSEDLKFDNMESKFSTHYDAVENNLKSSTVGLLTVEEMKNRQQDAIRQREMALARKDKELLKIQKQEEKEKEAKKLKQKQQIKTLSFNMDDDDDDEDDDDDDDEKDEDNKSQIKEKSQDTNEISDTILKKKRLGKNPDVDTSFLPDIDRDEQENELREKLRKEWEEKQAELKEETINITFSYWDGSGHRRSLTMKKGHTIYQFLVKCLETLRSDFLELKTVTADQLMYVKEDLILPQTNTFYDFIVTKARGKSGPLFSFDVHEDIRIISDASIEKDESHAGKVVLRSWYERNKHIFPASRWEPYDPTKSYSKYTVADKK